MSSAASRVRKETAPLVGRSRPQRRSARWFWEIDKVLLVLVAVLISIGLIAVAAASPAAAQRYSGGGISVPPLYYFYRQLIWIALAVPVMIAVSMLAQDDRAAALDPRRGRLHRAAVPGADHRRRGERRAALARRRLRPSSSRPNS